MTSFPFPGPDAVFGATSSLAMLGWTALALSPARARWAGAARLFAGRVVPLLLAVVYVALFARNGVLGLWETLTSRFMSKRASKRGPS